jgi:tRNA(fMet)-specific endonuclease VapC
MFDTATAVAILRRSSEGLLLRLQQTAIWDVCISAVTQSELAYGIATSRRPGEDRAVVEVFLRHVRVLEYPGEAAEAYARIREVIEICGAGVSENELLVAAHAQSLGITLVTNKSWAWKQVG